MPDQIGSVRDVVNVSGPSVVYSEDFTPYGNTVFAVGSTAPVFGFAGLVADPNSGLSYSASRFYDPTSGRWIHRDPIAESGGVDLYAYAGGNPLNEVDPGGAFWWAAPVALATGAATYHTTGNLPAALIATAVSGAVATFAPAAGFESGGEAAAAYLALAGGVSYSSTFVYKYGYIGQNWAQSSLDATESATLAMFAEAASGSAFAASLAKGPWVTTAASGASIGLDTLMEDSLKAHQQSHPVFPLGGSCEESPPPVPHGF